MVATNSKMFQNMAWSPKPEEFIFFSCFAVMCFLSVQASFSTMLIDSAPSRCKGNAPCLLVELHPQPHRIVDIGTAIFGRRTGRYSWRSGAMAGARSFGSFACSAAMARSKAAITLACVRSGASFQDTISCPLPIAHFSAFSADLAGIALISDIDSQVSGTFNSLAASADPSLAKRGNHYGVQGAPTSGLPSLYPSLGVLISARATIRISGFHCTAPFRKYRPAARMAAFLE